MFMALFSIFLIKIGHNDVVVWYCSINDHHRCQQRLGGYQWTGGQAPLIGICSGAVAVAMEWENN